MSNYYEILQVDPWADAKAIRQSYLKLSLKHHPDKNPGCDKEVAKARFCAIGEAYGVLSDPTQRSQYDLYLKRRHPQSFHPSSSSSSSSSNGASQQHYATQQQQDRSYESYQDIFDSTVASMSEEELAVAIGAIGVVAGVIGSIVGSRMAASAVGGSSSSAHTASRGTSAASSFLSSAGSIVGSMVASHAATEAAKVLHRQAIEKIAYKEELKQCQARGQPMPPPPSKVRWDETLQRAMGSMMNSVTSNAANGTNTGSSSSASSSMPTSERSAWQSKLQSAVNAAKSSAATAAAKQMAEAMLQKAAQEMKKPAR